MKLSRRALANEVRTLELRDRVQCATIDTLQRQVLRLTLDRDRARLERDRALATNVRLAHDLEELEAGVIDGAERLRAFFTEHPSFFDQDQGDAA